MSSTNTHFLCTKPIVYLHESKNRLNFYFNKQSKTTPKKHEKNLQNYNHFCNFAPQKQTKNMQE